MDLLQFFGLRPGTADNQTKRLQSEQNTATHKVSRVQCENNITLTQAPLASVEGRVGLSTRLQFICGNVPMVWHLLIYENLFIVFSVFRNRK